MVFPPAQTRGSLGAEVAPVEPVVKSVRVPYSGVLVLPLLKNRSVAHRCTSDDASNKAVAAAFRSPWVWIPWIFVSVFVATGSYEL